MVADSSPVPNEIRVDGGMIANDWLAQFLADILDVPVRRPVTLETTALGAAFLAGLGIGWYRDLDNIAAQWRSERRFEPQMPASERDRRYSGWLQTVQRIRTI